MADDGVIPEDVRDILESASLAHISTIGPKGGPQSNPVWFDYDAEFVKFSQTKTRRKHRNIGREPRLAHSILGPENPYRYLEVRGEVERVMEDPDNAFINKMAKKCMDVDEYPLHQPGDERIVLYVRPEHTTTM